ncbi:uncharacterized protein LOC141614385 [Silene latifolia]|uniref:uncharacterized protein LOC141614385 n=1 Tax=Silene latifolia TaxID=37657 RepID=UPI003D77DABA
MSGFQERPIPFRYLGIPISYKRISVGDCSRLVERMMSRIRGWGAYKLSYAGRYTLVQSVLSQLYTYWARIFIIPITVINKLMGICRNFLWSGSEEFLKVPPVSWDRICQDKKSGGLGVINSRIWNQAMIGKYCWWIVSKAGHLWIKWVNHIYIKGQAWFDYIPTNNSSWAWRIICKVKEQLKAGYVQNVWCSKDGTYCTANGYDWLMGQSIRVPWYPIVWSSLNLPKTSFIAWLYMQQRPLTKDRLCHFGMNINPICDLCLVHSEDHDHLFFQCKFSKACLQCVNDWLGMQIPETQAVQWCLQLRSTSLLKKQILWCVLCDLIYRIWLARNVCRVDAYTPHPSVILRVIQGDISTRIKTRISVVKHRESLVWLKSLSLI